MKRLWSVVVLFANNSRAFSPPSSSRRLIASTSSAATYPSATLPISFLRMMSSNNEDLDRAKRKISEAISIGAPAYNAGDVKKCADVYGVAAKEIAPLLPSVLSVLQKTLLQEAGGGGNDTTNYDSKAWALRRAFDSIVDYTPPLVPRDVAGDWIAFEPFTQAQLGGEPACVMDSVMGGISRGGWISGSNTFFGETSLANNGGFASLRWRLPTAQDWSRARGLYIKGLRHSRAEEHTFRIVLKDATCERVRLANFKAVFANPDKAEGALLIPFSAFDQMEQMGRALPGSPAFDPRRVTEFGLMAIKPTVVGEFQVEFSEWGLYS